MNGPTFRVPVISVVDHDERRRRDEAEWHAKMAKEGALPSRRDPLPPPLASPFYRRVTSLDATPTSSDVVQFPLRKRENSPPPLPLPPAQPMKPAALREFLKDVIAPMKPDALGEFLRDVNKRAAAPPLPSSSRLLTWRKP